MTPPLQLLNNLEAERRKSKRRSHRMPNIAVILKQEIMRLARREARSLTKSLSKASAQFRRDIAELKRQNSKARAEIGRLQRQIAKGEAAAVSEPKPRKIRYSARSVATQRKRLGMSATDYGKLCGVSGQTVYAWEHGISRPRKAQLAAFVAIRGVGKAQAKTRLEQLSSKARKGRKKKG